MRAERIGLGMGALALGIAASLAWAGRGDVAGLPRPLLTELCRQIGGQVQESTLPEKPAICRCVDGREFRSARDFKRDPKTRVPTVSCEAHPASSRDSVVEEAVDKEVPAIHEQGARRPVRTVGPTGGGSGGGGVGGEPEMGAADEPATTPHTATAPAQ